MTLLSDFLGFKSMLTLIFGLTNFLSTRITCVFLFSRIFGCKFEPNNSRGVELFFFVSQRFGWWDCCWLYSVDLVFLLILFSLGGLVFSSSFWKLSGFSIRNRLILHFFFSPFGVAEC